MKITHRAQFWFLPFQTHPRLFWTQKPTIHTPINCLALPKWIFVYPEARLILSFLPQNHKFPLLCPYVSILPPPHDNPGHQNLHTTSQNKQKLSSQRNTIEIKVSPLTPDSLQMNFQTLEILHAYCRIITLHHHNIRDPVDERHLLGTNYQLLFSQMPEAHLPYDR